MQRKRKHHSQTIRRYTFCLIAKANNSYSWHSGNVLGKRLQDAVPGNVLHSRCDLLQEPLVAAQVVTEQVSDAEQLGRVGASCTSFGLELLPHRVVDGKCVAAVIDAVNVTEPSCCDEAQTAERA